MHSGFDCPSNSKLLIQALSFATVFSHQLTKRDANPLSTGLLLQPENLSHQPTRGRHFPTMPAILYQLLVTNRMGNSSLLKRDKNQQPTRCRTPIQAPCANFIPLLWIRYAIQKQTIHQTISKRRPLEFPPHPSYSSSKLRRGFSYHQPATKMGTIRAPSIKSATTVNNQRRGMPTKAPLQPIKPVLTPPAVLCGAIMTPVCKENRELAESLTHDTLDDDGSSISLYLTGTLDYLVCK